MKKTFFILLLSTITFHSQSQEVSATQKTMRFGVNRAFYGAGDIFGTSIYSEYSYQINKYIDISPRVSFGFAYSKDDMTSDHLSSFSINCNADITPFPEKFKKLKCFLGPLFYYQANTYGPIEGEVNENEYTLLNATTNDEKTFGALIGLRFNFFETEDLEIGTRFDMLTNFGGFLWTDSWQFGIYFGKKF